MFPCSLTPCYVGRGKIGIQIKMVMICNTKWVKDIGECGARSSRVTDPVVN